MTRREKIELAAAYLILLACVVWIVLGFDRNYRTFVATLFAFAGTLCQATNAFREWRGHPRSGALFFGGWVVLFFAGAVALGSSLRVVLG